MINKSKRMIRRDKGERRRSAGNIEELWKRDRKTEEGEEKERDERWP